MKVKVLKTVPGLTESKGLNKGDVADLSAGAAGSLVLDGYAEFLESDDEDALKAAVTEHPVVAADATDFDGPDDDDDDDDEKAEKPRRRRRRAAAPEVDADAAPEVTEPAISAVVA